MTRRRLTIALAVLALLTALAAALHGSHPPAARRTPDGAATAAPRLRAPLTPAEINRQDHAPARLLRAQAAAIAQRPMLPALPITSEGVSIRIAGLAPDGRTTILSLTDGGLGRAHALAVYREQLRRYGDSGHDYQLRVAP